jgi:integrase
MARRKVGWMAGKKGHRTWGRIRRLPSKRYQANYVGPDLVRHNAPTTFTTKMDAEAWLHAERRLIELGTWVAPALRVAHKKARVVTLGDYARTWIDERPVKPRTRIGYQALLDRHIAPTLGEVPLKNLSPELVRTWFAALGTEHVRRNSHAYGLLHAICKTAVDDGMMVATPCNIARVMNPPRKREPVILTVPEVAALADAIRPERFKAFVLVSAWCGLRWGEVTELRRKDIGEGCGVLHVSRATTHRNGCRIDSPKSGKGRAIVVPPHIRDDLQHHLDEHVADDAEALLFPPARGGCHLSDKVFRTYFISALGAVGRMNARIHDLRHFAGTQNARVGNLTENMARLGHVTVRASLMYQGIVAGRDHEVAAALSQLATAPGNDGDGETLARPARKRRPDRRVTERIG